MRLARTPTVHRPGPIRTTGEPLHAAIRGDGFFAVADEQGRRFLTLAGDFLRSPDGLLVTANLRYRVLDAAMTPIEIPGEAVHVTLRPDGAVLADGEAVATVGRFSVADPARMMPRGDARFEPHPDDAPVVRSDPLAVGSIEESNVELVSEMVRMIEATRQMELNLRLMRVQDELLGRTVREAGSAG